MMIWAPISAGELFDKITILRLKAERIRDPAKLADVHFELSQLEEIVDKSKPYDPKLAGLIGELYRVNAELWDIEVAKRAAEESQSFGSSFVENARAVYLVNDRRASIKHQINLLLGSDIVEQKCHDAS